MEVGEPLELLCSEVSTELGREPAGAVTFVPFACQLAEMELFNDCIIEFWDS